MKNEWLEKYKSSMSSRYPTFKLAFDMLLDLPEHRIVETGCVRLQNDWGAGYSTVLFGEFCKLHGGKLITIDNTERHLNICKELTKEYSDNIEYWLGDSLNEMRKVQHKIDLLYLDSFDLDLFGNRNPSQEHNLKEFKVSEPHLHEKSIVLIDDCFNGDGKPKLTKEYMIDRGWKVLHERQQIIFSR